MRTTSYSFLILYLAVGFVTEYPARADSNRDSAVSLTQSQLTTVSALGCGLSGDAEQRAQLLQVALRADPDCSLARWHSGQVKHNGNWRSVDEYEKEIADDVLLHEYARRRDRALNDPRRELDLARWCQRHDMFDAHELHLRRVMQNPRSDPSSLQLAANRLGLKGYRGALLTSEEIDQLQRERREKQEAIKKWTPIVQKWRKAFLSGQPRRVRYARQQMSNLRDATAIPALESVMSDENVTLALEVIRSLAEMPMHASTVSLARHAMSSDWRQVAVAATTELKERPLHDFMPILLQGLIPPFESSVDMRGDFGAFQYRHVIRRQGLDTVLVRANQLAVRPRPVAVPVRVRDRETANEIRSEQLRELREAQVKARITAAAAAVVATRTEQQLAMVNAEINRANNRIFDALETTSGVHLPRRPTEWWDWWQDYNEVTKAPKRTYYIQSGRVETYGLPVPFRRKECFTAGTPVRTQSGYKPIEQIKIGDRVLSQDVDTGQLAYKLVTETTVRQPSAMLKLTIGQSEIVTTKGHPIWVNGTGWRMAKRLRTGHQLHSLSGGTKLLRVSEVDSATAYNLVVEDFGTYFVSRNDVLAHDNTYRSPTTAIMPGVAAEMLSETK